MAILAFNEGTPKRTERLRATLRRGLARPALGVAKQLDECLVGGSFGRGADGERLGERLGRTLNCFVLFWVLTLKKQLWVSNLFVLFWVLRFFKMLL